MTSGPRLESGCGASGTTTSGICKGGPGGGGTRANAGTTGGEGEDVAAGAGVDADTDANGPAAAAAAAAAPAPYPAPAMESATGRLRALASPCGVADATGLSLRVPCSDSSTDPTCADAAGDGVPPRSAEAKGMGGTTGVLGGARAAATGPAPRPAVGPAGGAGSLFSWSAFVGGAGRPVFLCDVSAHVEGGG